jgi:hypothetical protein
VLNPVVTAAPPAAPAAGTVQVLTFAGSQVEPVRPLTSYLVRLITEAVELAPVLSVIDPFITALPLIYKTKALVRNPAERV